VLGTPLIILGMAVWSVVKCVRLQYFTLILYFLISGALIGREICVQPITDRVAHYLEIMSRDFRFNNRRPGFSWDRSFITGY